MIEFFIFIVIIVACSYTSWNIGLESGGEKMLDNLERAKIIKIDQNDNVTADCDHVYNTINKERNDEIFSKMSQKIEDTTQTEKQTYINRLMKNGFRGYITEMS